MNQALYAHVNNKTIKKREKRRQNGEKARCRTWCEIRYRARSPGILTII
jgi:hypothetical protein